MCLMLVSYIIIYQRGTKAHWVNTCTMFGWSLEIDVYNSQKTVPVVVVVDKSRTKGLHGLFG